jgi:hypothetical protein
MGEGRVPIKNGVPTCSLCGGTQFSARRKTSTKVMFGFASLAGTPHNVECEVCGARYSRPSVGKATRVDKRRASPTDVAARREAYLNEQAALEAAGP